MPGKFNTGGRRASKRTMNSGPGGSSYTNHKPLQNMQVMSLYSKKNVSSGETVSGKRLSGALTSKAIDASFTNIGPLDGSGLNIDAKNVTITGNLNSDGIILDVSQNWEQWGNDIYGDATDDKAGYSVALSSDGLTLAVGAPYHDSDKGQVRVYDLRAGFKQWIKRDDIDGDATDDNAGYSVALSSNGLIVAVGAPGHNILNGNSNAGQVKVYSYNHNTTSWTQIGTSDIDGVSTNEKHGSSVALSSDGQILAIGGYGYSSYKGRVRVYYLNNNNWSELGNTYIVGDFDNDYFGWSVALSSDGTTLAIGSYKHNNNDAGLVRVYDHSGVELPNNLWVQRGQDIDGTAANDFMGRSVALSSDGQIVAVGANGHDLVPMDGDNAGRVRVYDFSMSSHDWEPKGTDIDGNAGDSAGYSVALSSNGQTVAVGAKSHNGESGQVKVYNYSSNDWVQKGQDFDGDATNDFMGWSVALSSDGKNLAVGSIGSSSSKGLVKTYKNQDSAIFKFNNIEYKINCDIK